MRAVTPSPVRARRSSLGHGRHAPRHDITCCVENRGTGAAAADRDHLRGLHLDGAVASEQRPGTDRKQEYRDADSDGQRATASRGRGRWRSTIDSQFLEQVCSFVHRSTVLEKSSSVPAQPLNRHLAGDGSDPFQHTGRVEGRLPGVGRHACQVGRHEGADGDGLSLGRYGGRERTFGPFAVFIAVLARRATGLGRSHQSTGPAAVDARLPGRPCRGGCAPGRRDSCDRTVRGPSSRLGRATGS